MLVSNRLLAFIYNTTKKNETKNSIGQLIDTYRMDTEYKCSIQPISEKAIKYVWGNKIKSEIQIYCNEDLKINDVIIINSKAYKVEDKKDWIDYKMYAILEAKINLC